MARRHHMPGSAGLLLLLFVSSLQLLLLGPSGVYVKRANESELTPCVSTLLSLPPQAISRLLFGRFFPLWGSSSNNIKQQQQEAAAAALHSLLKQPQMQSLFVNAKKTSLLCQAAAAAGGNATPSTKVGATTSSSNSNSSSSNISSSNSNSNSSSRDSAPKEVDGVAGVYRRCDYCSCRCCCCMCTMFLRSSQQDNRVSLVMIQKRCSSCSSG